MKKLVFILLLISIVFNLNSQIVKGKVYDLKTGDPALGALIFSPGTLASATDINGDFSMDLDHPTPFTFEITYLGYTPINFTVNESSISKQYATSENVKGLGRLKVEYIVVDRSTSAAIRNKAFEESIKKYIEPQIKAWQVKGEFEKSTDFQTRVNDATRKIKIDQLTQVYIDSLKQVEAKKLTNLKFNISSYDPDNETYLIENVTWGKFALPVPIADAPVVKNNWSYAKLLNPDFYLDNGKFRLSKFSIIVNGSTYTYDSKIPTTYSNSSITYNFAPIDISVPQDKPVGGNQQINTGGTVTIGSADVDTNIPASSTVNDKTFVVIIANENYQRESKVDFAVNDGKVFKSYCEKTLGIPSANIHYVENATYGNLLAEKDWLANNLNAYKGGAKALFYYAGHGIPGGQDQPAYLLPADGTSANISSALKLDDLYSTLTQYPSNGVTVFLDACFSGSTRDAAMLASARSTRLKPRESLLPGNLVVFSAASGDETAWPYKDKQHGIFTYYLLKKLQETSGNITYKDLSYYINDNVYKTSIKINNKPQTSAVNAGVDATGWENWKLK